jgi:transcriptional regulator with XRE-family HTH domain
MFQIEMQHRAMPRSHHSSPYKKLRAALLNARLDAAMTQAQVAARVKRPQSFVSKYESGERQLDVVEFVGVCKAIGVLPVDVIALLQ